MGFLCLRAGTNYFIIPLSIAWIYLYKLPPIFKRVYEDRLIVERELREVKIKAGNEKILTEEQANKILVENTKLEAELESIHLKYKEQSNALISENQSKDNKIADLEKTIEDNRKVEDADVKNLSVPEIAVMAAKEDSENSSSVTNERVDTPETNERPADTGTAIKDIDITDEASWSIEDFLARLLLAHIGVFSADEEIEAIELRGVINDAPRGFDEEIFDSLLQRLEELHLVNVSGAPNRRDVSLTERGANLVDMSIYPSVANVTFIKQVRGASSEILDKLRSADGTPLLKRVLQESTSPDIKRLRTDILNFMESENYITVDLNESNVPKVSITEKGEKSLSTNVWI